MIPSCYSTDSLNTAISNTRSFLLCSCLCVQVSALDSGTDCTNVLYITFVLVLRSVANTFSTILTMPAASPIHRSTSLSQDWSAETVRPRYTKCSVCFRLLSSSFMSTPLSVLLFQCTALQCWSH